MSHVELNRKQVIARMRIGDLPVSSDTGRLVHFDDDCVAKGKTMRQLQKDGFVYPPQGGSVYSPWTLAEKE